jgi:hypothetical protein
MKRPPAEPGAYERSWKAATEWPLEMGYGPGAMLLA